MITRNELMSQSPDFEPLMDSHEAADALQIHFKTLERKARKGEVPATRNGKAWVFRLSLLNTWLNAQMMANLGERAVEVDEG